MTVKGAIWAGLALLSSPLIASVAPPPTTEIAKANLAKAGPIESFDLSQLADGIDDGALNSEAITAAYLARIAAVDDNGPMLNAVIATFPDALDQARAMDAELKAGKYRGPMHGMPVLVKDNIEVAGPIPTTAGSLALATNVTGRDAPLIARLREAGAVILGKTNLSEWANIRSEKSTSGWSAVGGLTKNPHALDRNSCGSSSGSGSAMAAGLAAATIGTETDGSITCPSGVNGIVGFKPTVGLISRRFVVPISHSQDTAGPMTRTVRDAAIMLTAMAGTDPQDAATAEADRWRGNYAAGLSVTALSGMRIGVLRAPDVDAARFDAAIATLKAGGAEIILLDSSKVDGEKMGAAEFKVLLAELKADLAAYLQGLPQNLVPHKTLADIIAFNKVHADTELAYFGQETFELADKEAGLDDPAYKTALATSRQLAADALNSMLTTHRLDVIVAQTNGPAWVSTLGKGDAFTGPSASQWPAIAGFPHLTVPMGLSGGLPVGLSFIGAKWHDHVVLKAGFAYEQLSQMRSVPKFAASVDEKQ
ncbi:amidase [Sphingorhabdus sp. IMCC26285]|uniref:Amidase n=1 Tax=Sphingorhabdus profundilacus TaxID=2509718 RepID=A0A6I4M347_9SPHN|nr:amidase [Sphingorhabdus profundilacus]MVZ98754.1 amidase [Sphingorhabdus profundilacus]